MERNYTEKELKTQIMQETIDGVKYYYGIGKKDQKSLSVLSN
jgi:hypothetical protein